MKTHSKDVIIIILLVVIVLSNLFWFRFYAKEKNNLRHSLVPITSGDYFQEQLALVNSYGKDVEKQAEIFYSSNNYPGSLFEDLTFKNDVPFIYQTPDYPNGCEAVSAVMLLQDYGIDITTDEFIDKYMKKGSIFSQDGDRFGPNPKTTYAGDPTSLMGGFGIFAPGIQLAMEKVLADKLDKYYDYAVLGPDDKSPLSTLMMYNVPLII